MSVDELAAESGVGRSTILRYENRKGRAYAETLQALRDVLESRGLRFLGRNGIQWTLDDEADENE